MTVCNMAAASDVAAGLSALCVSSAAQDDVMVHKTVDVASLNDYDMSARYSRANDSDSGSDRGAVRGTAEAPRHDHVHAGVWANITHDATPICARSAFTVSYARGRNAAARAATSITLSPDVVACQESSNMATRVAVRADITEQVAAVRAHRLSLHQRWVDAHERAACMTAGDARIAVKMLLRAAAQRDLALAAGSGYAPVVVAFMRQAWRTYVQEADTLLDATACTTAAAQPCDDSDSAAKANDRDDNSGNALDKMHTPTFADCVSDDDVVRHDADAAARVAATLPTRPNMRAVENVKMRYDSVAALEYVSSAGVWYSGPSMSMPLRRYAIQTLAADGTVQDAVLVGYAHFNYSAYVMQLRNASQTATLAELQRVSEQLSTRCLFTPRLIVAPTQP